MISVVDCGGNSDTLLTWRFAESFTEVPGSSKVTMGMNPQGNVRGAGAIGWKLHEEFRSISGI